MKIARLLLLSLAETQRERTAGQAVDPHVTPGKKVERSSEAGVDRPVKKWYYWRLPRNAVVNDQNNAD